MFAQTCMYEFIQRKFATTMRKNEEYRILQRYITQIYMCKMKKEFFLNYSQYSDIITYGSFFFFIVVAREMFMRINNL